MLASITFNLLREKDAGELLPDVKQLFQVLNGPKARKQRIFLTTPELWGMFFLCAWIKQVHAMWLCQLKLKEESFHIL